MSLENFNIHANLEEPSFKGSPVEAGLLVAGMHSIDHDKEIKTTLHNPSGEYTVIFTDGSRIQIDPSDSILIREN